MDPAAAPRKPEYLGLLLADAKFRKRIAPIDIRLVVFVGGATTNIYKSGDVGCISGVTYAGGIVVCAGYVDWDKSTHLGATIVDMFNTNQPIDFDVTAQGNPWLLVIPPFIPLENSPNTQRQACLSLGRQIAHHLNGESVSPDD